MSKHNRRNNDNDNSGCKHSKGCCFKETNNGIKTFYDSDDVRFVGNPKYVIGNGHGKITVTYKNGMFHASSLINGLDDTFNLKELVEFIDDNLGCCYNMAYNAIMWACRR